jgi:hypothetical protein
MENPGKVFPIRRSSRTTPSLYRKIGDQKSLDTIEKSKPNS